MSITVTWTCDYEDCAVTEVFEVNDEFWPIDQESDTLTMPPILMSSLRWCHYERDEHPRGRVLCDEHEQVVRIARNIKLCA